MESVAVIDTARPWNAPVTLMSRPAVSVASRTKPLVPPAMMSRPAESVADRQVAPRRCRDVAGNRRRTGQRDILRAL
ncbi:hypothetical protein, partial [Burkholderia ubonensis]|uniref:hypothetical protein n=1 Tax=Burkholderia ubonensis TaxID=101571 RepID=UPI00210B1865